MQTTTTQRKQTIMDTKMNFSMDFGDGFAVSQSQSSATQEPRINGQFHRLTPEKFDALVDAFDLDNGYNGIDNEIQTITMDDGRTFRTTSINFGGLILDIFADVVATVEA